jgi:hypothetical protein
MISVYSILLTALFLCGLFRGSPIFRSVCFYCRANPYTHTPLFSFILYTLIALSLQLVRFLLGQASGSCTCWREVSIPRFIETYPKLDSHQPTPTLYSSQILCVYMYTVAHTPFHNRTVYTYSILYTVISKIATLNLALTKDALFWGDCFKVAFFVSEFRFVFEINPPE